MRRASYPDFAASAFLRVERIRSIPAIFIADERKSAVLA
jgi:hypothetical protein